MPVLNALMHEWPEVQRYLDFFDRMIEVAEDGLDVVIRTGQAKDSRLIMRTPGTFGCSLVASPSYLKVHGQPEATSTLVRHCCFHHRTPMTGRLAASRPFNLPITASLPQ